LGRSLENYFKGISVTDYPNFQIDPIMRVSCLVLVDTQTEHQRCMSIRQNFERQEGAIIQTFDVPIY
jgi:hypothetical protein